MTSGCPTVAANPTPMFYVSDLDLWIKDERAQPTGSFKVRGATRWIERTEGCGPIVTASSGNHARALWWVLSARHDQRHLIVVTCSNAHPTKVAALVEVGCEVRVCDGDNQARDDLARRLAVDLGGTYCSSHDDPLVIDGQAGVVREVLIRRPKARSIFVPVGGGGLFAGSLLAAAHARTPTEVIGVEPAGAAAMAKSLAEGQLVRLDNTETACDALRAVAPGRLCLEIALRHRARVATVDDSQVFEAHRLITSKIGPVELSAAVAVAGAIASGERGAVCVITGGSITSPSS